MKKETVRKAADARQANGTPGQGGVPSKKTDADIGAITKGSSGRPKAAPRGSDAGTTKANQTTSTSFPKSPVPKSFLNKLGEMHKAEKELTLALPLIAKAAKNKELKTLLNVHLKETRGHVKGLEQVAASLGEELPSKSCKPMTQLIGEGVKVIGKRLVSSEQDPALIAVGQKIEQFEISSYTELCAKAEEMDWTHELAILTSILSQEKLASDLLADLGQGKSGLSMLVRKASLKHA